MRSKLLRYITNFHLRPFELTFDNLRPLGVKKSCQNGAKLRLKITKTVVWSFSGGFVYKSDMILLSKTFTDIKNFHLRPISLLWRYFVVPYGKISDKKGSELGRKSKEKILFGH